jgi:ribosomal protein S18 acetylase RimI-like enzyme
MPETAIAPARPERRQALVDVLVSAFRDDPIFRWVYPGELYARLAPEWFSLATERLWARADAYVDGSGDAASFWVRPGYPLFEPNDLVAMEALFRRQLGDRSEAVMAAGGATDGYEPDSPHGFCFYVGVRGAAQGQGLGQAVMRPALERLDQAGLPAYLVSTNARNVSFYRRFGFEVTAEVEQVPGVTVRPMLRQPGGGGAR